MCNFVIINFIFSKPERHGPRFLTKELKSDESMLNEAERDYLI